MVAGLSQYGGGCVRLMLAMPRISALSARPAPATTAAAPASPPAFAPASQSDFHGRLSHPV